MYKAKLIFEGSKVQAKNPLWGGGGEGCMDIICVEQIFELAEVTFEGSKVQTKNQFWGWGGEGGGDRVGREVVMGWGGR